MKKVLFSVFAVIASSLFCTNICMANYEVSASTSTVVATSTRTVSVWKIQGNVTSQIREGGVYDSESNTITVRERTYNVQSNPNYGGSGKTANYQYCAGGMYYFNL